MKIEKYANEQIIHIVHNYTFSFNAKQIIKLLHQPFDIQYCHDKEYKLSFYNYCLQYHQKWIIFNTLYQSLSCLTEEEYHQLLQLQDVSLDLKIQFVKLGFWIDKTKEERQIYQDILFKIRPYVLSHELGLTILPTLKCNARCFYCFEHGIKQTIMNQQTADHLIQFITSKNIQNIHLTWFGGEPMMNPDIIEYICSCLTNKKISFTSQMVSNGYLLDNTEIIQKAIVSWHLHKVQITIDGLTKTYNQRKNYRNPCSNPFAKIIQNIQLLSHFHVQVVIRLNIDRDNLDEMIELCQWLSVVFKENPYVQVYAEFIRDNPQTNISILSSYEERKEALEKILPILIYGNLFSIESMFQTYPKINACMNDHCQAYVINPDGSVCLCENESGNPQKTIGTIYTKFEPLFRFLNISKTCYDCQLLPMCLGGCQYSHSLGLDPCFSIRYSLDSLLKMYIESR